MKQSLNNTDFPRKKDGTLDFVAYSKQNKETQEMMEKTLDSQGTSALNQFKAFCDKEDAAREAQRKRVERQEAAAGGENHRSFWQKLFSRK